MRLNIGKGLCFVVLGLTIVASALLVVTHNAKPEHLLTILGIIAGIAVVVYQLGEQQRASLELQRENARQELKLRVYEQLNAKAVKAQKTNRDVRWYAHSIVSQLQLYVNGNERDLIPWTVDKRAAEFLNLSAQAGDSCVALMIEIERWEISFGSAELFRMALTSASYDIQAAFHPFLAAAVPLLPTDRAPHGQGVYPQPVVTRRELDALEPLADSYFYSCDEFECYVHDLIVEAQNELLSTLFENRVAVRKPLDARHKVITASRRLELTQYFKNDTRSGRAYSEATASVVSKLGDREQAG